KLEHAMRAGVVRVEMGAREWPAAVRDPLTRREIDRIERRTETGPVSRGAAEVVQARGLKGEVRQTHDLAAIELLHPRVVVEAARLQEEHALARTDPLQRHRDARGARADDAEISLDDAAILQRAGVGMHGCVLVRSGLEEREESTLSRFSRREDPAEDDHRAASVEVVVDETRDVLGRAPREASSPGQRLPDRVMERL